MNIKIALVLSGLCAFGGGCSPLASVTRPEPELSRRGEGTDGKLADLAWEQLREATPEVAYGVDFSEGFKKGFVDYLRGATQGEPPSTPPSRYGQKDYESVQGRKAILDWFRGFREGAVQAQASGLRPTPTVPAAVILPTSLPDLPKDRTARVPHARGTEISLPEMLVSPSGEAPAPQDHPRKDGDHSPL